jgi:hypothetical protein
VSPCPGPSDVFILAAIKRASVPPFTFDTQTRM